MFPSNTACISKNYLRLSNPKRAHSFYLESGILLSPTFFCYLEVESESTVTLSVELAVDSDVAVAVESAVASDVAFPVASFELHEETKIAVETKIPKKNLFIFILFYYFVSNLTYGDLRLYLYTLF